MAQFGRPASDISTNNWTTTATNLFEVIDEATAVDTDYIEADGDSSPTTAEVKLSSVTDPTSSITHVLRFRAIGIGASGPERLDIDLVENTTVRANAFVNLAITRGSYNDYSYTLSAAEADSITDYADLRIRFIMAVLGSGEQIRVSWAELEVPDAAGDLSISVSDTVAVAETVGRVLEAFISESEAVGVAETVGSVLEAFVNVNDSVAVAESETVTLPDALDVSASDTVAVAESTGPRLDSDIAESESITVVDTPRYYSDNIVVTESVTVSILAAEGDLTISVSESVGVAESVKLNLILLPSVSDAVSVAETVKPNLILLVSDSDAVSVAETVKPNLILLVSESEAVSVAESVATTLPDALEISASDTVSVTESVSLSISSLGDLSLSVSDSVSVAESVTVRLDLLPSVSDSVSVAETTTASIDLGLSVSDSVTVADSASIGPVIIDLVTSDGVSVAESITPDLSISVDLGDAVGVAESITAVLPDALAVAVVETVTISEAVSLFGLTTEGEPDNTVYVIYNDRRSFVVFSDRRAFAVRRDKRSIV